MSENKERDSTPSIIFAICLYLTISLVYMTNMQIREELKEVNKNLKELCQNVRTAK